ncbi:MAG TPA: lysoplasmalogenase [Woeseiaceae bacterium]|jgi:uncharacterized membrane protein YhhN
MAEAAGPYRRQYAIVAIGIVACFALVATQLGGFYAAGVFAKLVASSSFVAIALSVGAMRAPFGRILLAGLVLSWIGDMLLLGRTEALFLSGLIAFLIAHVAYIAAFTVHGIAWRWALVAAIPVVAISVLVSMWLSPHVPESMQFPVWLYTAFISCMVMCAIGARGAGAVIAIPLGALLFYFSDLSVAAGQFVRPEFPNFVWGLPFYYGGQLLLAWSAGSAPQTDQSSAGAGDFR